MHTVETPFGSVHVKTKWIDDKPIAATPEYDDCRALAESANLPVRTVHDAATAAAHALLLSLQNPASR